MIKNSMKYMLASLGFAMILSGCSGTTDTATGWGDDAPTKETTTAVEGATDQDTETGQAYTTQMTELTGATGGKLSAEDLFTERDLSQTVDITGATSYQLEDGKDITITAKASTSSKERQPTSPSTSMPATPIRSRSCSMALPS